MSNLRVNIRIFYWHLQVTKNWGISISYNEFHKGLPDGWFEVYDFKPFKKSK